MNKPSTSRRSADEWRSLIDEQQRSGQSQAAFCHQRGVSLSSFGYWRRKLKSPMPAAAPEGEASPLWIEWPASADCRTPPPNSRQQPAWDLELDLGNGLQLRLRHVVS